MEMESVGVVLLLFSSSVPVVVLLAGVATGSVARVSFGGSDRSQ